MAKTQVCLGKVEQDIEEKVEDGMHSGGRVGIRCAGRREGCEGWLD